MQLSRSQVLELIRLHGETNREDEAKHVLPETVDTDRDKDLLRRFGLDEETIASAGSDTGV